MALKDSERTIMKSKIHAAAGLTGFAIILAS